MTGTTTSTNFPITPGAFQISFQGGLNNVAVFVTKLNAAGDGLVYSTYLVGSGIANNSNNEQGNGIAVDYAGNAYVTGSTTSISFPITPDGFRNSTPGTLKAFATKLSVAGDGLVYSTYFCGGKAPLNHIRIPPRLQFCPLVQCEPQNRDSYRGPEYPLEKFPQDYRRRFGLLGR